MLGDLKVIDPLCSEEAKVGLLGGAVAFGNTRPAVRLKMFGHLQRGQALSIPPPALATLHRCLATTLARSRMGPTLWQCSSKLLVVSVQTSSAC